MPHPLPSCTRRTLLGAVTALPVLGRLGTLLAAPLPTVAARPPETPFPEGATILVAGPDGGGLHLWARAMQPAFAQSLAPGTTVHQTDIGGPDGVTGANQFEVRVAPDGRTVLLVPGDAVLA